MLAAFLACADMGCKATLWESVAPACGSFDTTAAMYAIRVFLISYYVASSRSEKRCIRRSELWVQLKRGRYLDLIPTVLKMQHYRLSGKQGIKILQ